MVDRHRLEEGRLESEGDGANGNEARKGAHAVRPRATGLCGSGGTEKAVRLRPTMGMEDDTHALEEVLLALWDADDDPVTLALVASVTP